MTGKFKICLRNLTIVILIVSLCSCVSWLSLDEEISLPKLKGDYRLVNMAYVDLLEDIAIPSWLSDYSEIKSFNGFRNSVKNTIMDSSEPETGYYCYTWDIRTEDTGYLWGGIWLHSLFAGLTLLFGVPTDIKTCYCSIHLYLFNSNGEFLKEITGVDTITRSAGIYYGYYCKEDPAIQKAFKSIEKQLSKRIQLINQSLQEAGPNTPEKEATAKKKIKESIKRNTENILHFSDSVSTGGGEYYYCDITPEGVINQNYRRTVVSRPTVSANTNAAAPSQTQNNNINPMKSPLKGGRYDAVGIPNCYATITPLGSSGTLNMFLGGSSASGDYKIDGSQIVVNYMFANGDFSSKKGSTEIYQILSETRFRTGGTVFVYAGY